MEASAIASVKENYCHESLCESYRDVLTFSLNSKCRLYTLTLTLTLTLTQWNATTIVYNMYGETPFRLVHSVRQPCCRKCGKLYWRHSSVQYEYILGAVV